MRLPVLALLTTLAACTAAPNDEAAILATVNGDVITAEEFRLNYEFGHGHLRRGANPREDYLRFMILELVLAQEAQRLNLDTAAAILHASHTLREELLIERVFEEHVLAQIEVSDEEIMAAQNADAVRFQFRFLPAKTWAEAVSLRAVATANGFDAAVSVLENEFSELGLDPDNLESPALSADEIEPEVLEVLRNLHLNEMSEPVEYRGGWYLFEVTGIQRQPIAPEDYADRASSYRKVVYNRKAMEQAGEFVSELMAPLNVVTAREGFDVLSQALWAWYEQETPTRNLLHYMEAGLVDQDLAQFLVAAYTVPLVSFGDREWTIRTFLEHYTPGRYVLRARDRMAFEQRLSDVIALVVRDHLLLSMADSERLYENESFERTSTLWMQKWLFQELRAIAVDSTSVTKTEVGAYYARKNDEMGGRLRAFEALDSLDQRRILQQMLRDRLLQYADSLADDASIEINHAVLDTMTFSRSAVNPQMTVHLLKSNSNKMPFPIADPNWRTAAKR